MQIEKLRSLIRESINEYIKEIDEAGTRAMYEAKMKACDEAMDARKKKIEMAESLEEMQGMFDETKMGDLKKEIKMLEKQKAKYGKMLEKMNKGKEVVTEEPAEEAPVDEADVTAEMAIDEAKKKDKKEEDKKDKKDKEEINESFLKMQKLAGVITESEYKEKTNEIFGFGSKPKFKDGDKVYIKVGGHDNSEWETEPRKISISRQKPYKDKRGMMYRVTTNPDKQGNFFTNGGLDVPEQNIKLA